MKNEGATRKEDDFDPKLASSLPMHSTVRQSDQDQQ